MFHRKDNHVEYYEDHMRYKNDEHKPKKFRIIEKMNVNKSYFKRRLTHLGIWMIIKTM
jgi:hypothetical protein